MEIIYAQEWVPRNDLLGKIDAAIDFTQIGDYISDLYCKDNRWSSIDPVALLR